MSFAVFLEVPVCHMRLPTEITFVIAVLIAGLLGLC